MKKILTALMSGFAALSVTISAFAAMPFDFTWANDETVTLIVEVEGDALLASDEAQKFGADYINTQKAQEQKSKLIASQAQVMSTISQKTKVKQSPGYTYTAVFNGFSIDVPKSRIEEIRTLPGVKNVYVSRKMKPSLASAVEQTSSLPMNTANDVMPEGCSGEGQVIAIIDSEFDTGHEFFREAPQNPKLDKSDVADVLQNNTMNVAVAANQVYKSSKIPFAYDYINKSADTYDKTVIHGTHVAGIAAGKNGKSAAVNPDGELTGFAFSGIAPEAQLVLMKISYSDGFLEDAAAVAAIDDAVKLGVCAINMSFNTTYVSPTVNPMYDEVLRNTRSAGVMLLTANGNSGMGYSGIDVDVQRPDYSTTGIPAGSSPATDVGSVCNTHIFSSFGALKSSEGKMTAYTNAFSGSRFDEIYNDKTVSYVDCGLGYPSDFESKDVKGKIALIARGELQFTEKAENAKVAGAEAIILYNNVDGTENLPITAELVLPAAMTEKSGGEYLKNAAIKEITVYKTMLFRKNIASAGEVSPFSSYSTNETLELKPEISAPGAYIYSSFPDDTYNTSSGTSMAAPHMTGVAALMNEYLDKNKIDISGEERVTLIENMLMSAAEVTYQPGIYQERAPYSPRVQGAGMVNTAAAMKTPAVFIGNSGKSKLSLGDKIGSEFTLDFTVKNLTDHEVVYDDLGLEVFTDGYLPDENDGTNDIVLNHTVNVKVLKSGLPESVTVPANNEAKLNVSVTLDSDWLEENTKIFTNGFFIDGFVTFAVHDKSIPIISMPFTGFYGDWTAQPIFDKTMYDEGGSELYHVGFENLYGTFLFTNVTDRRIPLGVKSDGAFDADRIAISPNGDGAGDELSLALTLWRTAKNLTLELDGEGVHVVQDEDGVLPKYTGETILFEELNKLDESELPDGAYTLTISGELNYDGAERNTLSLPVIVDREKPEITDVNITDNTLTVTARDNNYLYGAELLYTDENGEEMSENTGLVGNRDEKVTAEFDISGINPDDITIRLWDCANNFKTVKATNAVGAIQAELTRCDAVGKATSAAVELKNTSESTIKGVACLAFYDERGALLAIKQQDISIGAYDSKPYEFNMIADTKAAKQAKLFLWENLKTLRPIDCAKGFALQN